MNPPTRTEEAFETVIEAHLLNDGQLGGNRSPPSAAVATAN